MTLSFRQISRERDTVCPLGIPRNPSRQYSLFSGETKAGRSYMAIKDFTNIRREPFYL